MRIFTGVKPSGHLQIGNYFGAIKPALDLQNQGEGIYFIADYHALTTVQNADEFRSYIEEVELGWLACGLDPKKSIFFRQSAIPEVNELAWLLSTLTPMGLLERCHAYKDAVSNGFAASHGLFAYPVLMAADILLYQADVVPVGKDQKQHVEVTRDLAMKFNEKFGTVFTLPEPRISEDVATIIGIDGRKMSKSYDNTLQMFGDEKLFQKRVMSIKTDSTPVEAPKPVEGSTLVELYKLVATPEELAEFKADLQRGGRGYGDYKKQLLEKLKTCFAPIRERYFDLKSRPDDVRDIMQDGTKRARAIAQKTLDAARHAVGLT
ncbi:MAG: tryptophan--tRNA ligase [Verrucomicrobia bacterium Tous-C9LFEB]|nr:MAG: tryptophan--tRNA ligase [Verrucomicrobia bacterium Tous-C9LFEB]